MTEEDVYENSHAERLNGTIKNNYLLHYSHFTDTVPLPVFHILAIPNPRNMKTGKPGKEKNSQASDQ